MNKNNFPYKLAAYIAMAILSVFFFAITVAVEGIPISFLCYVLTGLLWYFVGKANDDDFKPPMA